MDSSEALSKLDHVINISRSEMYKPIQVAEVLYQFRMGNLKDLSKLDAYRIASRKWRNDVTKILFGKISTSSAKYQDDIWNNDAVPPAAMVELAKINQKGELEQRIYLEFLSRYELIKSVIASLKSALSAQEVFDQIEKFNQPKLISSADRLFESLVHAVTKVELNNSGIRMHFKFIEEYTKFEGALSSLLAETISKELQLTAAKLGHTNAADAGLDIWTNFGVVINVKRMTLNEKLLNKILEDTPVGRLHIFCLDVKPELQKKLSGIGKSREITVSTFDDIKRSILRFQEKPLVWEMFISELNSGLSSEFPVSEEIVNFVHMRGYVD